MEERDGARGEVSVGNVSQLPWRGRAIAARRAYLERWLRHQLPVRLANNQALANGRLAALALVLALLSGEKVIRRVNALEVIRTTASCRPGVRALGWAQPADRLEQIE